MNNWICEEDQQGSCFFFPVFLYQWSEHYLAIQGFVLNNLLDSVHFTETTYGKRTSWGEGETGGLSLGKVSIVWGA